MITPTTSATMSTAAKNRGAVFFRNSFQFIKANIDYDVFFETMNANHLHTVYGSYAKVLKHFCEITGIEYICYN